MKKGFTLVEIVAVIVIVGTIILLVTPLVIGTVNKSKDNAKIQSARLYIKAIDVSISNAKLNDIYISDGKYSIMENGDICLGKLTNGYCDSDVLEIIADGEMPVYGKLSIEKGIIKNLVIVFSDDRTVSQEDNGELVLGNLPDELLGPGLYDEDNNLVYSWEELIEEDIIKVTDGALTKSTNKDLLVGKLVIDESVTSIGSYAFNGCTGLTSITIPNSVTSIGSYAFYGCTRLTSITIPNSVTSIAYEVFRGCTGLTSVTIPNSVTSIGYGAFRGCTGLTSITIPSTVMSFSGYAFYGCTGLTSITIPNNVTSIGNHEFYGCTGLTSITIPNSVTSIENYAFYGCTGLTSINYKGTQTQWNSISFGSYWDNNTPSDKVINYNYAG